jgi:hypothetical protein
MGNTGTRLSSRWDFSQDAEEGSPTRVELHLPFDPGGDQLDRIEFNNGGLIDEWLAKLPHSPYESAGEKRVSIVVKNITAFFYPGSEMGPFVTADLVSMVSAK